MLPNVKLVTSDTLPDYVCVHEFRRKLSTTLHNKPYIKKWVKNILNLMSQRETQWYRLYESDNNIVFQIRNRDKHTITLIYNNSNGCINSSYEFTTAQVTDPYLRKNFQHIQDYTLSNRSPV